MDGLFKSNVSINNNLNVLNKSYFYDNVSLYKNLNVSGSTYLNNTLETLNDATFYNNVSIQKSLNVNGSTNLYNKLNSYENASFYKYVQIYNDLNCSSNVNINGILNLYNNASFYSNLWVNESVNLSGNISVIGITDTYNTVYHHENVSLDKQIYIVGDSILYGNEYLYSGLNVSGISYFNNIAYFNQNCFYSKNINLSGNINISNNLNISGQSNFYNTLNLDSNSAIYSNASINTNSNISVRGNSYLYSHVLINSSLSVNDMAILNASLNVNGITNFYNDSYSRTNHYITNKLNVSGNTSLHNNVTIDNNLLVYGSETIQNNLTVNGNASVYGTTNFNGIMNANSTTNLKNNVNILGSSLEIGSDTNNTIVTNIYGPTNIKSTTTLDGQTIVNGDANFNGVLNVNAAGNSFNVTGTATIATLKCAAIQSIQGQPQLNNNVNQLTLQDFYYADYNSSGNISSITQFAGFALFNSSTTFHSQLLVQSNVSRISSVQFGGLSNVSSDSINFNTFTYGNLIHDGVIKLGLGNSKYGNTPTTFDLSANSAANSTGIIYNGPINIGSGSYNTLNLNSNNFNTNLTGGTSGLKYNGIINVSSSNATLELTGGSSKIDAYTFNIGTVAPCAINIRGNNGTTGVGINYDGPINIGSNDSTYNLNVSSRGTFNYSGLINVYNELRIKPGGHLVIESSQNAITLLQTEVQVTEQINVSNNGTGPAMIVDQIDSFSHDIAQFRDNNVTVMSIGHQGDTRMSGKLRIGYNNFNYDILSNDIPNTDYDLNVSGSGYFGKDIFLIGNVTALSDIKFKTNLEPLKDCVSKIKEINGYKYDRTDIKQSRNIGLIAQEVETEFPELIMNHGKIKSVNYQAFTAVLLGCIKELEERISILEKK
jgi:hypothetical protein